MKINQSGINLIKQFEGCRLVAYLCPANVWTIGYGHTGKEVRRGLVWTQQKANLALTIDLSKFEIEVDNLVKSELNDNQFSALISFAYNLGSSALRNSTLLKLVNANPNNPAIATEFMKWVKAGGIVLPGLQRRRQAESELYFKEVT